MGQLLRVHLRYVSPSRWTLHVVLCNGDALAACVSWKIELSFEPRAFVAQICQLDGLRMHGSLQAHGIVRSQRVNAADARKLSRTLLNLPHIPRREHLDVVATSEPSRADEIEAQECELCIR